MSELKRGSPAFFLLCLSSLLTQYDQKICARERKRKQVVNIYRLAHFLGGVQRMRDRMGASLELESKEACQLLRQVVLIHDVFEGANFPPILKLIKMLDAYLTKGKLPKIPVAKENKSALG